MSNNGFNPVTGRVVTHEHFAPKWGEHVKAPIRKALLEEGLSTSEAARRFGVPQYVVSNVRSNLVRQGKIPNRKQIMRETINQLKSQAAQDKGSIVESNPSPQTRGVETRMKNGVERWKDRYVASEARRLALEEELQTVKTLLKRYW